jgi:hypothetical protein
MPSQTTVTARHFFGGGWATDFGPTVDVSPDQSGKVMIPFLTDAENCLYELDGAPHKIGGASKVNSFGARVRGRGDRGVRLLEAGRCGCTDQATDRALRDQGSVGCR